MPFTIHLVNTAQPGVRNAYLDAWRRSTRAIRHPDGRRLHIA